MVVNFFKRKRHWIFLVFQFEVIMINVIFDFESLGLNENSVLLSLGVLAFDPSDYDIAGDGVEVTFNKLLQQGLYVKLDAKDQMKTYGRNINKSTLLWWTEQNEEASQVLTRRDDDVKLPDMENLLNEYLEMNGVTNNTPVWSRGYTEPMWYESIKLNLNTYGSIRHYQYRDIRTLLNVAIEDKYLSRNHINTIEHPVSFIKHNALHDVCFDAVQFLCTQ